MKRILSLLSLCFFTIGLFAQSSSIPTTWKIKKFGISAGVEMDMIDNLEYGYLLSTGRNVDESRYAGMEFDPEDMYSGVCENPHLRFTVTMGVPMIKNTELNLSLLSIFNRYDGVHYSNYNYNYNDYFDFNQNYEYLSVNSMANELALEGSLVRRFNYRFLNLYGGAGTNLGYSYGGNLSIDGTTNRNDIDNNSDRNLREIAQGNFYQDYTYQNYELKNAFHQRLFAQVGVGIVFFKRLEVGLDYRGGVGYKAIVGAPLKMTKLRSVALSARWVLRK